MARFSEVEKTLICDRRSRMRWFLIAAAAVGVVSCTASEHFMLGSDD